MSQSDQLYRIAALQLFNGSFKLDTNFCQTINLNLSTVQRESNSKGWNPEAFATTLALAYFNLKLKSREDDWALIADKSKLWLIDSYAQQADAMFETAIKLIQ